MKGRNRATTLHRPTRTRLAARLGCPADRRRRAGVRVSAFRGGTNYARIRASPACRRSRGPHGRGRSGFGRRGIAGRRPSRQTSDHRGQSGDVARQPSPAIAKIAEPRRMLRDARLPGAGHERERAGNGAMGGDESHSFADRRHVPIITCPARSPKLPRLSMTLSSCLTLWSARPPKTALGGTACISPGSSRPNM